MAHVLNQAVSYFLFLRTNVTTEVDAIIKASGEATKEQVEALVSKHVQEELNRWRGYEYSADMDEEHRGEVTEHYTPVLQRAFESVLQKLPISNQQHQDLMEIGSYLFTKDSLRAMKVEARIADRLKYSRRTDDSTDISPDVGAAIVPFAQSDVVGLFINGIDPTYERIVNGYLKGVFQEYPKQIVETLEGLSEEAKEAFITKWQEVGASLLTEYQGRIREQAESKYVSPMLDVVEALPKNELASLAEALVNLTSLKRKVSLETETVGGPVDVAVISKGDGLVWIQRKQYFRADLNHQFFANYYRTQPQEST